MCLMMDGTRVTDQNGERVGFNCFRREMDLDGPVMLRVIRDVDETRLRGDGLVVGVRRLC